jgi:hypothetical protein
MKECPFRDADALVGEGIAEDDFMIHEDPLGELIGRAGLQSYPNRSRQRISVIFA